MRIRYGYRKILVLLQREGWLVGKTAGSRLYREEGLTLRRTGGGSAHGRWWMTDHEKPETIRMDKGPELASRHLLAWGVERRIELVHIRPGKPT